MSNSDFFEHERLTTVKSSVFFLSTAVLMGLPLWWCTTTVYRAELPIDEVEYLLKQPVEVSTNIFVQFGLKDATSQLDLKNRLLSLLDYDLALSKSEEDDDCITFKYRVLNAESLPEDVKDFDGEGSVHIKLNDLEEDMEVNVNEEIPMFVDIDKARNLTTFYLGDIRNADLEILISPVAQFIKRNLVRENVLRSEYRMGLDNEGSDSSAPDFSKSKPANKKANGRRLNAHRGNYDIVFSLIFPETDILKNYNLEWNIQESISTFLIPLLEKFENLADFNVASQIIYQMKLGAKPTLHFDKNTMEKYNVFYDTDVPHLITPIDRKTGFSLTNSTVLNLVSYVTTTAKKNPAVLPSDDNLPLFFLNEEKELRTMAFYDNWGCILLHNIEMPDPHSTAENASLTSNDIGGETNEKAKLHIDATYQLKAFIPNIGKFLGVEPIRTFGVGETNFPLRENENIESVEQYELTVVSPLQLDVLYRRRTLRNIATAVTTMQSLISLCDHVKNMVIRDEIAANVEAAVQAVKQSRASLLEGGESLLEALRSSSVAHDLAEIAFSDPTILAMLYFPEDQKYAIYVPMFVPMSLPLWSSIGIVVGYWKLKRART